MSYSLLRDALFMLPAEVSHDATLSALKMAQTVGVLKCFTRPVTPLPTTVMGIDFPNPVGLAAGLDKNGRCIDALNTLGFGFVEVGTVTPKAQPGNAKPRLFRLPEHNAIINRMGFNNEGVEALLKNVAAVRSKMILGINIGKNASTPVEEASSDYLTCLRQVYAHANYVTVNLSSPNTAGLRTLQFGDTFAALLNSLKEEQQKLVQQHGRYVPLVVKIAPDLDDAEIASIANTLLAHSIDGVIATNTTITRDGVQNHTLAGEAGGLSGQPLREKSTHVVSCLAATVGSKLPIIAAGGIMCGADAAAKIKAGASLVQIYTGFIYCGPVLINDAVLAIKATQS